MIFRSSLQKYREFLRIFLRVIRCPDQKAAVIPPAMFCANPFRAFKFVFSVELKVRILYNR